MTVKEKKKLNRTKRMEENKNKQMRIKQGISPPPSPKLTLNNQMEILLKEPNSKNSKAIQPNVNEIEIGGTNNAYSTPTAV